jgi:hypothetical protein
MLSVAPQYGTYRLDNIPYMLCYISSVCCVLGKLNVVLLVTAIRMCVFLGH